MKTFLSVLLAVTFLAGPVSAQVKQLPVDRNKTVVKDQPVKMQPGVKTNTVKSADTVVKQSPPAAATTTQPPAAATPPAYYLVSARVRVATGDDNKELQSGAEVRIFKLSYTPGGASPGDFKAYPGQRLLFETRDEPRREFKVNSTNEIDLKSIYSLNYQAVDIMLGYVEPYGFKAVITYFPNFPLDAWRINNVTVVLEIKDRNGNPHPYMGYREILFSPNKLLKAGDNTLELFIDKNFMKQL
ncbi:MAG: hypothetical protein ABS85_00175 [Sphingobacteriales bacterium SCN 48-20]|uniref:hypothetical protein n=1 Tax=Terrimonas ferruginea TaxID=249 RepID=UPI0008690940|nr:hypothetical protein [Terrimonas ferruginea]MBN8782494.1 hypothetical protein [Terrimonas ferruginea]ODT96049.1 MAG: hypothetical protein ABS85_00175 [Sphingobacteriales bacterium SCN 48-20]OJW43004.1 MAG: hypothetical protein BGO56_13330 [Sphingobacteriales bacterium 48-107]